MPPQLQLYNTLTNTLEPFAPADPTHVTFYTCGPTVYDDAHIGNFRAFLFADLLRRFIESPLCTVTAPDGTPHKGPRRVTHVINITDVGHMTDDTNADGAGEDKMALAGQRLLEAKKQGKLPEDAEVDPKDPRAIAEFFADRYLKDAAKLGLKTAEIVTKSPKQARQLMPRASGHVDGMKAVIENLAQQGFAYAAGDPGSRAVYFDVQKFDDYGQLSGNKLDQLQGGAGGRVTAETHSEKRHPADFLLWKEDDAHLMKWPGPNIPTPDGPVQLGDGYPGWHIECTAMSLASLIPGGLGRIMGSNLPATIDLHTGGEDNIFPHHECEIAQTRALTGADTFARHWVHARYLFVDGKKMSKSKGTFHTPRELFDKGIDPAALRLELIKTHYRKNADFSLDELATSSRRVNGYRFLARRFMYAKATDARDFDAALCRRDDPTLELFFSALHDDLNIAGALGALARGLTTRYGFSAADQDEIDARARAFDAVAAEVELPTKPVSPDEAREMLASHDKWDRGLGRLHLIDNILGVIFRPEANPKSTQTAIGLFKGVDPDPEVEQLLADRAAARKAKDFAAADAIRDQLAAKGLAIKDAPGGKVEVTNA